MERRRVIRVAVVEDETEQRLSVVELLGSAAGFELVASCGSAEDAIRAIPATKADVVLMDINLPGQSGIECVRQLALAMPNTQFMMLTIYEDHSSIFESVKAGATGYILKKTPGPKLLEAIRDLHEGASPMSGQIARRVLAAFRQALTAEPSPRQESPLTQVEQKVLQRLGRGLLYKEVASDLGVTISTVRTHVNHIYRKLHVSNRTEALLKGGSWVHQVEAT